MKGNDRAAERDRYEQGAPDEKGNDDESDDGGERLENSLEYWAPCPRGAGDLVFSFEGAGKFESQRRRFNRDAGVRWSYGKDRRRSGSLQSYS